MKSLFLFPYCLFPINTGAKVEAWKTLDVLKSLGESTVFSAATKPVGTPWSLFDRDKIRKLGHGLVLREELQRKKSWEQVLGLIYASCCKAIGFERAFGHRNPYHRSSFPSDFWYRMTEQFDLAVINYSYWAFLPCECPKIVILHDLLSSTMTAYSKGETEDLLTAELIVVISCDEKHELHKRGIEKVLWSPPAIERIDVSDSGRIGVIGSANKFNAEGMRWLSTSDFTSEFSINVYGDVGKYAKREVFDCRGRYKDAMEPYHECGIILVPTAQGTGVQIKAVEALAAGRAIVARRGAMRGIPHSSDAWIEVDKPNEMIIAASRLAENTAERESLGRAAHSYYKKYLNASDIRGNLKSAIENVKGLNV